jgi:hypothetical protein
VLWSALALLLSAAVAVALVFGDDLWGGGGPVKTKDAAAPSIAQDDPAAETLPETGTLPDLPSVDEPADSGAEPTPTDPLEPDPTATTGDLGLAVPMTAPACDGSWVVFLGAATEPLRYAEDVQVLLDGNPSAQYTLTQGSCASMRQQLPDGTLIYAVWTGPYADQAAACAARASMGDAAYVKRMDDTTPAEQTWEC